MHKKIHNLQIDLKFKIRNYQYVCNNVAKELTGMVGPVLVFRWPTTTLGQIFIKKKKKMQFE